MCQSVVNVYSCRHRDVGQVHLCHKARHPSNHTGCWPSMVYFFTGAEPKRQCELTKPDRRYHGEPCWPCRSNLSRPRKTSTPHIPPHSSSRAYKPEPMMRMATSTPSSHPTFISSQTSTSSSSPRRPPQAATRAPARPPPVVISPSSSSIPSSSSPPRSSRPRPTPSSSNNTTTSSSSGRVRISPAAARAGMVMTSPPSSSSSSSSSSRPSRASPSGSYSSRSRNPNGSTHITPPSSTSPSRPTISRPRPLILASTLVQPPNGNNNSYTPRRSINPNIAPRPAPSPPQRRPGIPISTSSSPPRKTNPSTSTPSGSRASPARKQDKSKDNKPTIAARMVAALRSPTHKQSFESFACVDSRRLESERS